MKKKAEYNFLSGDFAALFPPLSLSVDLSN
jgi:hypothetical protein